MVKVESFLGILLLPFCLCVAKGLSQWGSHFMSCAEWGSVLQQDSPLHVLCNFPWFQGLGMTILMSKIHIHSGIHSFVFL